MTQASPQAVYALIGRTFASELFEPLYQHSLAERARRHASGRGLRRSDGRRWHASGEIMAMPAAALAG